MCPVLRASNQHVLRLQGLGHSDSSDEDDTGAGSDGDELQSGVFTLLNVSGQVSDAEEAAPYEAIPFAVLVELLR